LRFRSLKVQGLRKLHSGNKLSRNPNPSLSRYSGENGKDHRNKFGRWEPIDYCSFIYSRFFIHAVERGAEEIRETSVTTLKVFFKQTNKKQVSMKS